MCHSGSATVTNPMDREESISTIHMAREVWDVKYKFINKNGSDKSKQGKCETQAHTRTHTHARAHTHTYTHTHSRKGFLEEK